MNIGELFVRLTADARGVKKGSDDAKRYLGELQGVANRVGGALALFGVGFSAAQVIQGIIGVNREYERLLSQLQTTEGSLASARGAFQLIEEFAASTPFAVNELTEAFISLRVRGVQPTEAMLTGLGDLAAAFGVNITDVTRGIGSAAAGQMDTLQQLGFQASVAGNQVTLAFNGMERTVPRSAAAIANAVSELASGTLGGAMAREMNTLNGAISNFQDNIGTLARAIGEAGLNQALNDVASSMRDFSGGVAENREELNRTVRVLLAFGTTAASVIRIIHNTFQQVADLIQLTMVSANLAVVRFAQNTVDAINLIPGVTLRGFGSTITALEAAMATATANFRGNIADISDAAGDVRAAFARIGAGGEVEALADRIGGGTRTSVTGGLVAATEQAEKLREVLRTMGGPFYDLAGPQQEPRLPNGQTIDLSAAQAASAAMRRAAETTAALDLELRETVGWARFFGSRLEEGAGVMGQFWDALKTQGAAAVSEFGALALVAAALAPVFQGFRDALGPSLAALAVPLRVVGEVLGTVLLPVLRLLFPVFKGLGIAASIVGEVFFTVAAGITNAIAALLEGIGKALAKLPFVGNNNDVAKAGRAMREVADGFSNTSRDLAVARRELQGLDFEDAMEGATDAVERFTSSVTNMAPIFDLALRRRQAGIGGIPAAPAPAAAGVGAGVTVVIQNPPTGMDVERVAQQVTRGIVEARRRGGVVPLDLAYQRAR